MHSSTCACTLTTLIIGASRVVGQCDPAIYSSLNTSGNAQGVAVSGTLAYLADGISLQVVDVSTPQSPAIIGTAGTTGAVDVVVAGTVAYVADGIAGRSGSRR